MNISFYTRVSPCPQVDREMSAAHLVSNCRGLIFHAIKEPVLRSALSDTAYADGGQFNLNLSRSKVRQSTHPPDRT